MQSIDEPLLRGYLPPPEGRVDDDEGWEETLNSGIKVDDSNHLPGPHFPPGPDFVQLEWGPLPTKRDYEFAHSLWTRPNSTLDASDDSPYPQERHDVREFLTKNVYAYLEAQGFDLPPTEDSWNVQAQFRFQDGRPALWAYEELEHFKPNKSVPAVHDLLIAGRSKKPRLWTVSQLKDELSARGLSDRAKNEKWLKQRMIDELFTYEQNQHDVGSQLCPRQSLDRWGIKRGAQNIVACQDRDGRLSPLHLYTWALCLSPYNPVYWISRAFLFYQQGYFDLAIGDTYRTLHLVNELMNKTKKPTTAGLHVRVWDAIEQHILTSSKSGAQGNLDEVFVKLKTLNGLNLFIPHLTRTSYHILSLSLLGLQAWHDWAKVERWIIDKIKQPKRYAEPFHRRWKNLRRHVFARSELRTNTAPRWRHELTAGVVCGRTYPQSAGDVGRGTQAFRERLNLEFFPSQSARKNEGRTVEVREKGNGELGVFALRDFEQGQVIYTEKPSARGILKRAQSFDHRNILEPVTCENCQRPITMDARYMNADGDHYSKHELMRAAAQGHNSICQCIAMKPDLHWCGISAGSEGADENERAQDFEMSNAPETTSLVNKRTGIPDARGVSKGAKAFKGVKRSLRKRPQKSPSREQAKSREPTPRQVTNSRTTCLEEAREQYHFQACGVDWSWLHRSMQQDKSIEEVENQRVTGGDQREQEGDYEAHGTALSLLVREVFDMTLLKRTSAAEKNILAHEIDVMLPLCGAENLSERHFPFGYLANIVIPFNILLRLGVDIFKQLEFDTWIIQTVMRKLLMNCLPWDQKLRGNQKAGPRSKHAGRGKGAPATFENLYLHTGFAIFNHACVAAANADWSWEEFTADQAQNITIIPNRIVVSARHAIARDEEIRIQYYPGNASPDEQIQLFGRSCDCYHCSPAESST